MTVPLHQWNQPLWRSVTAERGRVAHGLLLSGPQGLGKRVFAEQLAAFLLCQSPMNGMSCGTCAICQRFAGGSQADLHVLQPDALTATVADRLSRYALRYQTERAGKRKEPSAIVAVEQVRALIESMLTRAHSARCKVAIIEPADQMNVNAANALLKLLEEPPADSYFILVSHRPDRISATVRSRCGTVDFRIPARRPALEWLRGQLAGDDNDPELLLDLAAGAPLRALSLAQGEFVTRRRQMIADLGAMLGGRADPVACAGQWKAAAGVVHCIDWLQGWVMDAIRLRMAPGWSRLGNPDGRRQLQESTGTINLQALFSYLERLYEGRRLMDGQPVDEGLLLEELLIRWSLLGVARQPNNTA